MIGRVAILFREGSRRIVRESHTERLERSEGVSHVDACGRNIISREDSNEGGFREGK